MFQVRGEMRWEWEEYYVGRKVLEEQAAHASCHATAQAHHARQNWTRWENNKAHASHGMVTGMFHAAAAGIQQHTPCHAPHEPTGFRHGGSGARGGKCSACVQVCSVGVGRVEQAAKLLRAHVFGRRQHVDTHGTTQLRSPTERQVVAINNKNQQTSCRQNQWAKARCHTPVTHYHYPLSTIRIIRNNTNPKEKKRWYEGGEDVEREREMGKGEGVGIYILYYYHVVNNQ